jgi:CRISPR-associated protein Csd1
MLPDLVRAAGDGHGIFAELRPAFRKRSPDARAIICSDGRLVIEPWPTVDGHRDKIFAPDARRSGTPTKGREGAIPLCDRADYTFGIQDREKPPGRSDLLKEGYLRMLHDAADATALTPLLDLHAALSDPVRVRNALAKALPLFGGNVLAPQAVVACYDDNGPLFARPEFISWWQGQVAESATAGGGSIKQQCSICGQMGVPVETIRNEIYLTGQKCQVSSFKPTSFQSYGKAQTLQASICAGCASLVPSALLALLGDQSHSALVYRHAPKGRASDAMKCLTAVWWLEAPQPTPELSPATGEDGGVDWESALAEMESELPAAAGLTGSDDVRPLPHVDQARAIFQKIRSGGDGRRVAMLDRTSFHVALLAANTGRLIVRDYLRVDISKLLDCIKAFLLAARGFRFDQTTREIVRYPFGAASLARALHSGGSESPTLLRGLLRTALQGDAPPPAILPLVVPKLIRSVVKGEADGPQADAAIAALLLYLIHTDSRFRNMADEITPEILEQNESAAFQAGRVAAVLDGIQRASDPRIPKTSVEKMIVAMAAGPAAAISQLLRRAITVYLPKVRAKISVSTGERFAAQLDDAVAAVHARGGFPPRLVGAAQAEFMTGFCVTRSFLRKATSTAILRKAAGAPTRRTAPTLPVQQTIDIGSATIT